MPNNMKNEIDILMVDSPYFQINAKMTKNFARELENQLDQCGRIPFKEMREFHYLLKEILKGL